MSSWRDEILKEFTPNISRLTLVCDPDELLLEEGILEGIRKRGFDLIPFEDHIAFRYLYEMKYRFRWDKGEQTELVVVLRSPASDISHLPFDLLQAGRKLSFNLGDIFPNLSYPIVMTLNRQDLDALHEAQIRHAPGRLGDNASKEFIMRHVFEIAPELIKQPSDLLRVLLRRHYSSKTIPKIMDDHFIQILRQNDAFTEWPLERIIPDKEAFFAFLQERWRVFLDRSVKQKDSSVREQRDEYGLEYPGPSDLPFDHHDIRVYIDNLFLEGLLQAVSHEEGEALSKTWLKIGIRTNEIEDKSRRLEGLLENIESKIPTEESSYNEWFPVAKNWAELLVLVLETQAVTSESIKQKIKTLQSQIDMLFVAWLKKHYAGLINLPPVPPVMLHHILRLLSRHIGDAKNNKAAFIIIDGLSFDQWIVIRKVLSEQNCNIMMRESAIFAWIPTITSVSRQAAFAGKSPIYFPDSIYTTAKEPTLWTQFWVDQGLMQHEIVYAKGLGDGLFENIEEMISNPKTRVAALVIDKVDKIMHGMELGTEGMHNQVRQWAGQKFLINMFELLLNNGFSVYITSDHGNIEAEGCGRPGEGAVADLRGERVRIYSDCVLRDKVKKQYPNSLEWPPIGLVENFLPLIAPNRSAFIREAEHIVSHGGISLEEVVVPLIQVERKKV